MRVYELAMQDAPSPKNALAVESILAAKAAIDSARIHPQYSKNADMYLTRAKIYGHLLTHPKGHPDIDRMRGLTITPMFNALQQYETLADTVAMTSLWEQMLKQTFMIAFEAEQAGKERLATERTMEGATIIHYLEKDQRDDAFAKYDASFANLFTMILRRDVARGQLGRAHGLVPMLKVWYPDNGPIWLTIVNYHIRNDEPGKALEAARKAIPLNKDARDAVREQLYFTAGNLAVKNAPMEALEYFEKAAAINPDAYGPVYNIGVIYTKLGYGAAEKALAIQADNPAEARQWVARKINYFTKALPYLEKAYQLRPSQQLRNNIATIYRDLGETEQAQQWMQKGS